MLRECKLYFEFMKIKGRNKSLPFAPDLTMNLTYLCSGCIKYFYLPLTAFKIVKMFFYRLKCCGGVIEDFKNKKEE